VNPVGGVVDGVKVLVTGHRLDQQSAELDAVYIPQWRAFVQRSQSAKLGGSVVMLIVLVGGWFGLWMKAKKLGVFPIRHAPAKAWVDVEPLIVVCNQCGVKNRHKAHRAGQKLVCGNCKTELGPETILIQPFTAIMLNHLLGSIKSAFNGKSVVAVGDHSGVLWAENPHACRPFYANRLKANLKSEEPKCLANSY